MAPKQPDSQLPSYSRAIRTYFYLLVLVMVVTLAVAVFLYGEPFHFWAYPFSDLGSTATWEGKVNAPSRLTFTLGGLSAGWLMMHIWAAYTGEERYRNQPVKRNLGALGMAGFLLASVPNSQHHIIHTMGAVFAFASLYLFTMVFHVELREGMRAWQFWLDVILLQVVVFTYALAFFADWPTKQGFQKVALMGVYYTVLRSVSGREGR